MVTPRSIDRVAERHESNPLREYLRFVPGTAQPLLYPQLPSHAIQIAISKNKTLIYPWELRFTNGRQQVLPASCRCDLRAAALRMFKRFAAPEGVAEARWPFWGAGQFYLGTAVIRPAVCRRL
jgi:hypothetical protein